MFGNCLFLGAHCDDICTPCSGIIQKLLREGNELYCEIMTRSEDEVTNTVRTKEFFGGMRTLGVTECGRSLDQFDTKMTLQKTLESIELNLETMNVNTIFTHSPACPHQDHRIISEASRIACRKGNVNLVYYEDARYHLSHLPWKPNLFYELSAEEFETKKNAILCHKSQYEKNKEEFDQIIDRGRIERFQIAYLKL